MKQGTFMNSSGSNLLRRSTLPVRDVERVLNWIQTRDYLDIEAPSGVSEDAIAVGDDRWCTRSDGGGQE